jgi:hypothetical protein
LSTTRKNLVKVAHAIDAQSLLPAATPPLENEPPHRKLGRLNEWRGGAATNSDVSGGGDLRKANTTAATLAKHRKVPTLAAYDSGNSLSVATSIHERWPEKRIVIAGDDDHRIENNPGREKALAAAEAVAGVAIFPNFNAEQGAKGLTDFNDLATQNPEVLSQQISSTKTFETRLIAHSLAAENDCAISY